MALHVQNLRKTYVGPDGSAVPVIDVPELSIADGEQVALIGTSGSGKTTLLHLIAGIVGADAGHVVFDQRGPGAPPVDLRPREGGPSDAVLDYNSVQPDRSGPQSPLLPAGVTDLSQLSEAERDVFRGSQIGYIFQTHHLLAGFTALENVLLGMSFTGRKADREWAVHLLTEVGLKDRLNYLPAKLSVGQQQRVAVARALANRPRLVLADEPTGALDARNAQQVLQLIRSLCAEVGAALLLVSHDLQIANQLPRVLNLSDINRASTAPADLVGSRPRANDDDGQRTPDNGLPGMNLLQLVLKQMRQRALSTWLTLLSVLLGSALAIGVLILQRESGNVFVQTDFGYDVLVGVKGSPMQLVLNTIYHVDVSPGNVPYVLYEGLRNDRANVKFAVPYVVGDTYKGHRVVGTSPVFFGYSEEGTPLNGYDERGHLKPGFAASGGDSSGQTAAATFEYRVGHRFTLAQGRMFHPRKFEAVIGSELTEKTGLKLGDKFKVAHDAPAGRQTEEDLHEEEWQVVGVLNRTGTAEDRVVFIPMVSFYAIPQHEKALEMNYAAKSGLPQPAKESPKGPAKEPPPAPKKDDHDHDHDHAPKAPAAAAKPADAKALAGHDHDHAHDHDKPKAPATTPAATTAKSHAGHDHDHAPAPATPAAKPDVKKGHNHDHDHDHAPKSPAPATTPAVKADAHKGHDHDHDHDHTPKAPAAVTQPATTAPAHKHDDHGHDHAEHKAAGAGAAKDDHAGHDHGDAFDLNPDGTINLKLTKDKWQLSAILIKARSDFANMAMQHRFKTGDIAMAVNPASVMREFFNTFLKPSTLILLVVVLVVVVSAAVSILVSIYNAVVARSREIAIMRALGATRGKILTLICVEAGLIGLIGGLIGIIIGHGLGAVISTFFERKMGTGINWVSTSWHEWVYLGGVVILAVLAGLVPGLKAYRTPVATNLVAA